MATGSKLTESFPVVCVFNTIQISFIDERFLKVTVSSKFIVMVRFTRRFIWSDAFSPKAYETLL